MDDKTQSKSLKEIGPKAEFALKDLVKKKIVFKKYDVVSKLNELKSLMETGKVEKNKTKKSRNVKQINNVLYNLSKTYSLETHHLILECLEEEKRGFALEMIKKLEEEYKVKTPSEKALVQSAVLSFCQFQEYSQLLLSTSKPEWLSHEKAHFLSIYSKEADKANRRFISAIQTLKQMKTEPIKINVKANNAYMAQNQQINHSTDEKIKP